MEEMSTKELLISIDPLELKFPFELNKHITSSLQLTSKSDNYVAFKFKTTNPKKYLVCPNAGIVSPRSTCVITVTMQAQKEAPLDMQCRDKFLVQSVIARSRTTPKDVTLEMFAKESGNVVKECKLRVVYVPSTPSASATAQSGNEVIPSNASWVDKGKLSGTEVSLGSKLTDVKNAGIEQINKTEQESKELGCPFQPRSFMIKELKELVRIDPLELKFHFELKEQISSSLQLMNKTDKHVAFKVKTTNPKNYGVRPNTGVVSPRSTCEIIVRMQAQEEAPVNMQCKDKFLIQSVIASPETTAEDITCEMFTKESGNAVQEYKLKVVYLPSAPSTSTIAQGAHEVFTSNALGVVEGMSSGIEALKRGLMYFGVKLGHETCRPGDDEELKKCLLDKKVN